MPATNALPRRRAGILAAAAFAASRRRARAADVLRLDYAYYNPLSLVLRAKGWLQDTLGPDVAVEWVQSAGSNKALELLRGGSIAIGSTAGSAAVLGRANGVPIRAVYVYSQPEWTALVVRDGSDIQGVAGLKGRRVAATPGTDPFIFLLRALATVGLSRGDITLVPLQHQDGRLALDRGDVDVWAGLDPFMAQAELQSGDRLLFRDRALITPGTLLVREDFLAQYPDRTATVLRAYEKARLWALANPSDMAETLASAAKLTPEVAQRQLSRTDLTGHAFGPAQRASIAAAAGVLASSGAASADADIARAQAELIDAGLADALPSG